MPTIKLRIYLVDKRKIFPLKAKYNPETRLAQVRRSLRQTFPTRFQIDPDHIYEQRCRSKSTLVCFVDNASRKSIEIENVKAREVIENGKKHTETEIIKEKVEVGESHQIHTDAPVDGKMKNTLDFLVEEKFWKSLIAKTKLPLSTVLILLSAGMGLLALVTILLKLVFGLQLGL